MSYWGHFTSEQAYSDRVDEIFFYHLAPRIDESKYPKLYRNIIVEAWNLQTRSKRGGKVERTALSLEPSFYVYALLDPRKPGRYKYKVRDKVVHFSHEPFYIGKGKGNRVAFHQNYIEKNNKNIPKNNKIRKLNSLGLRPVEKILSIEQIEAVAFVKERLLIEAIGRKGRGPLLNLSDGGEGASGLKHTEETRRKISIKSRKNLRAMWATLPLENKVERARKSSVGYRKYWSALSDTEKAERIANSVAGFKVAWSRKPEHEKSARNAKSSATQKAVPHVECPYCGKVGHPNPMKRWHFERCRTITGAK